MSKDLKVCNYTLEVSVYKKLSLAFIVLITGIFGGLLIVFSILLLYKYCLNRQNLREAEQMKLLYETLNQAPLVDSNRLYQCGKREFSKLEPRRSNPLDRYQLPENQWQIPSSKTVPSDYHTSAADDVYDQSYHESREHTGNKPHDSHVFGKRVNDDDPTEQYLQVDPRCYVRQKSNTAVTTCKKSETPRLEKGHSINVDTRPSPSSSFLSPYRQSSFDVTLACPSQNQPSASPSPSVSTQQEIYFTPRGSSLSVVGNISTSTPPGSQHLSPPTPITSRQNSTIEKKDVTVQVDVSGRTSTIRSSIVQREHEHSRSLEQSSPSNNSTVDKQSHSFDAAHLLRPITHREDSLVNRRTKSIECTEEHPPPSTMSPVAPLPIIIKIPDMRELVQAAHLSQLQNKELDGYQGESTRKSTLGHQIILSYHPNGGITAEDLWRLRQSYVYEEQQQQLEGTSPDDLSPDLLTSTSIDSAGAMAIHQASKKTNNDGIEDDPSKYDHRRKSSSNLLLPPPEVRRQALRRTFEKRRRCINQSNAKREQELLNNPTGLEDDYNHSHQSSTMKSTDFSSLLNNFNSKSENSSFDRSLETDFDMQSDTSSRGLNDHFTSIESSGNENPLPDVNHHLLINQPQQQPSQQSDSGYKSLESQHSPNHTFSIDWTSADGGESVIYMDGSHNQQQRSVDLKDFEEEDCTEQQISNHNRPSSKFHQLSQETATTLKLPVLSNSKMIEQRSLSPKINLSPNKLVTSSSFNRTASKKRREFSKDKRHAASNVGLPHVITTDGYHISSSTIDQINEVNTKPTSSSTLQVRHPDLRRSKSDEAEIIDSSTKIFESYSNESNKNNNTHLSSSADGIVHPTSLPKPIRLNNIGDTRPIFQRSPSSTTPTVAVSPQIIAFRSQRGSISFDNPTAPNNSPTSNTTKTSTIYSTLPTNVTKPRLRFSMVRDTTTASLGSTSPSYSMSLGNDFSIDEKTNRIINEFLMQDNNNNKNMNDDLSKQESSKHHPQPIRQKTFDETLMMNKDNTQRPTQQQSRMALIKQRQHSFVQTNIRQQPPTPHPFSHLVDSNEHNAVKNKPQSPASTLTQQLEAVIRRDHSTAASFPSIIVTGYESGS